MSASPRSCSNGQLTRVALVALAFGAASCADPSEPAPHPMAIDAAVLDAGGIRPAEAHFHRLAREVPGFGGYFVDTSGAVVAYVTDLARSESLRGRIARLVERGRSGARVARVEIRKGAFDFPTLAHFRDIVSDQILGVVPGVVLSDADEAANRVTIGIDEAAHPEARGELMRALARAGVPASAVNVIVSGAMAPDVAPLAPAAPLFNQSVQDTPSPLVGGYRLITSDQAHVCTFGPVGEFNGRPAVLTNSHCTASTYGYDGGAIYTANYGSIGVEGLDPAATCGTNCRRSDAALIYLAAGVPYDVGRVARTTNTAWTWGTSGSLAVDQTSPTQDLIELSGTADVTTGMTVLKTGQTTGTTGGTVSNTCTDVVGSDGYKRGCTILSTYYSAGGDSGSPMYTYAPGTGALRLVGIHWGSNAVTHRALSSYSYWITSEISGAWVLTRSSPLAVYISGPSDVNNSPSCNLAYQAVATGGGEGYSYSWDTDGVINADYGDVVYASFPGTPEGRYIQVTVTSADGSVVSASLTVTSSSMYDMC